MQDFFFTFDNMKNLILIASSIIFSSLIHSCTVQENYTFNKDYSGHYSFQFDYSGLLDADSTGAANDEMSKGYLEMEGELKNINGLSNIIVVSDSEVGNVLVSYDFANLEALNEANYNKESKRYNKHFVLKGKKLSFTIDFSDELEEYKDPEMDDEELLRNIEIILDYTITFNFDKKVKAIQLNNFEQINDHTLVYKMTKESTLNPSSFQIKLN